MRQLLPVAAGYQLFHDVLLSLGKATHGGEVVVLVVSFHRQFDGNLFLVGIIVRGAFVI